MRKSKEKEATKVLPLLVLMVTILKRGPAAHCCLSARLADEFDFVSVEISEISGAPGAERVKWPPCS